MNTGDKIMIAGIFLGFAICAYSIWLTNQYMDACNAIDEKVRKYEQAERIYTL